MRQQQSQRPRVFTFGKYKDEPVATVIERDPDYVLWAARNIDFFELTGEEFMRLSGAIYERNHRQQPEPEKAGEWSPKFDLEEYFEPLPDYGEPVDPEDLEAYDRSFDEL